MYVSLDTIPTIAIVRDLADVVAVKPDGTRWKACSIKQLQHSCAGLLTSAIEYYEGADVTLRDILDANLIQAVVNTRLSALDAQSLKNFCAAGPQTPPASILKGTNSM